MDKDRDIYSPNDISRGEYYQNLYSHLNMWYSFFPPQEKNKTANVCDTWKIKVFQSNKGDAQKILWTVALLQYFL